MLVLIQKKNNKNNSNTGRLARITFFKCVRKDVLLVLHSHVLFDQYISFFLFV